MSLRNRPPTQSKRPQYGRSGTPAWLVFLLGIAVVFGLYYLWIGLRSFIDVGGLGVSEATARAEVVSSATAERRSTEVQAAVVNPLPTGTAIPECMDFRVSVPVANLRAAPTEDSLVIEGLAEGTVICVLGPAPADPEWYLIDRNPRTRRIEEGFMFNTIVEAVNPTPTATQTFTPPPTITELPTATPSNTAPPTPSPTPNTGATPTLLPTPSPAVTPTPPVQSA